MRIGDIFDTKIEEKIDPVIRVGERQNEKKLVEEVGSYVVTPTIEKYCDDFLEHYTETFRTATTDIGVWISGYFGSGKSHLAKIAALLVENSTLEGTPVTDRFKARVPSDADRRDSILRSLSCIPQCDTQVLAFNLNTAADSKETPLPHVLLSQYYLSKGYGANFIYARVIEAELDKLGKLQELHDAVERHSKKKWKDVQRNLTFYAKPLYQAACEVAPEAFSSPEEVADRLREANKGEIYNVQFLVQAILDDVTAREKALGKPCRFVFVLDESGQWIEDDQGRLAQLQALVEEAGNKGQGKLWVLVTTHEDMGTVFQNAKARRADFKKIEGRFRHKFSLTTENIELVLEDRLLKKTVSGDQDVVDTYNQNPGVLRDLGQLANCSQKLPECTDERFATFYPFFPYQIHLIPEVVKSLRSKGGRGEQLSGSTRTLLAIVQDILAGHGRRKYLKSAVGEMVSFDEVYHNLADNEVDPDHRDEMRRIPQIVPDAAELTQRVAEVLYLLGHLNYIPRTIDNICRLLVEHTTDDLASIRARVEPELGKLIAAKLVAHIGEEFEFLTGVKRTFEEDVSEIAAPMKWQDYEAGLAEFVGTSDVLGFDTVSHHGTEFQAKVLVDGNVVRKTGHVSISVNSPLKALGGTQISDLEDQSLRPDQQETIFILCDRIPTFTDHLRYYLATREVINEWKGDPHKSEEAHKLASERESQDLRKLRDRVADAFRDGLRRANIVFRGSSRAVTVKPGQTLGNALREELASYWPTLYSQFDKVPVRIVNEQRGILDVLKGDKNPTNDIQALKLYDNAGQVNPNCALLDAIRSFLTTRQDNNIRTLGSDLLERFVKPPYGWDAGAVRVGVAALVRAGAMSVVINKQTFTNPADEKLQDALRVSRNFDKVSLVLEDTQPAGDVLEEVRKVLINLTGRRKIDETPAALSAEIERFGAPLVADAEKVQLWAAPANLPLPTCFIEGKDTFAKINAMTNPSHRVNEIHAKKAELVGYAEAIRSATAFVEKWNSTFIEMRDFASQLSSVGYLLHADGACQAFLTDWRAAQGNCSVCDADVWKKLRDKHAAADVELKGLATLWKGEAKKRVQTALDRLPEELAQNELPAREVQEQFAAPLQEFVDSIDDVTNIAQTSSLSDQAENLIKKLGIAIQEEKAKRKGGGKPKKATKRVRLTDISTSVRIDSQEQWAVFRDKLDEVVQKELDDGNAVELG